MAEVSESLVLDIERAVLGGETKATAPDGRTVLVQGGAPGDRVVAVLTETRPRLLRAKVVEVERQGPNRVAPFCPLVGRCGGCPWQIMSTASQVQGLHEHLAHALSRTLKVDLPLAAPSAPPPDRAWRATARLHWREGVLGFHEEGSQRLLDIATCPVLSPPVQSLLDALRSHLRLPGEGTARLTAAPGEAGTIALQTDRPLDLSPLLTHPAVRGARLIRPSAPARDWGEPWDLLGPHRSPHPAGSFVQAHQPGNHALVQQATSLLEGCSRVLELYAGAGNFTWALAAQGAEVTAVEVDQRAAAALSESARARGLDGQVRGVAGSAHHLPSGRFDAALLDPPRAGAAQAVRALGERPLKRIVYVSCDPATLTRDLATLKAMGWWPTFAQVHHLFPHTGHMESLVCLERSRGRSL